MNITNILKTYKCLEFTEKTNVDAGYVAHRFRNKYPCLGIETKRIDINAKNHDWLNFLSRRGGLIYPSDELIRVAFKLDEAFYEMHGSLLSDEKLIFNKLVDKARPEGILEFKPFML